MAGAGARPVQVATTTDPGLNTIKTHIRHVYEKLDVYSRVELAQVVDRHT